MGRRPGPSPRHLCVLPLEWPTTIALIRTFNLARWIACQDKVAWCSNSTQANKGGLVSHCEHRRSPGLCPHGRQLPRRATAALPRTSYSGRNTRGDADEVIDDACGVCYGAAIGMALSYRRDGGCRSPDG